MNRATAKASGTKPGDLQNPVPGESAANADLSASQESLQNISPPSAPNPAPNAQASPGNAQPGADSDSQALDALILQAQGQGGAPTQPQEDLGAGTREMAGLRNPPPHPAEFAAGMVQGGIPAAVDAAATVGGGVLGSTLPGAGTAAGAEAGHLGGAALNVALAPYYRDIANKIREHFDLPQSEESNLHARVVQGISEAVGLVLPKILANGEAAKDFSAAKVVSQDPEIVKANLKNIQAAKDAGINPDPRMLFDKTSLSSKIDNGLDSIMKGQEGTTAHDTLRQIQQGNIGLDQAPGKSNAVLDSFNKIKDAVGTTVHPDGSLIIRPENIQTRLDKVLGPQIGDLNEKAIKMSGDKTYNVAPVLDRFKRAFKIIGIDSGDGSIPASTINTLGSEQKSLAQKYNNIIGEIKKNMAENGLTLESEQMKTPDTVNTSGNIELPSNATDSQKAAGVPLRKIFELADSLQDLANFSGKDRSVIEKQFGGIARQARDLRDQITQDVFSESSQNAFDQGLPEAGRTLSNDAQRLFNLNKNYGAHMDAKKSFYKAITANGNDAVNLIRKTNKPEWQNLIAPEKGAPVLSSEEMGALKSSYVNNLVDEASQGGVINPDTVKKIMDKDGDKAKILFGDDWENLEKLTNLAKLAERIDSNVGSASAPFFNKIASSVANIKSAFGAYFAESLFSRTPNVKKVLYDMPGYQQAIEKYMTPMTPFERTKTSSVVQGKLGAQGAILESKEINKGKRTMKDLTGSGVNP